MRRSAALALSAILTVLLPVTADAETSEKQTIKAVDGARIAPDFELDDLDDNVRKLTDYRGKVVAVNFWATWCPPCRKELPSMERAYKAYKDRGFVILGVNVGEDWDTVAPFLENFSLTYPILLDKDSSAMGKWKIMGLPTTFILDKDGRITHRITGGRDWDDPGFLKSLEEIITKGAKQ